MTRTRPGQLTVRDLMTSPVTTLGAGQSLSLAELLMERQRVRHLPVVAEGDRLVGLVTHRDLLRAKLGELEPVDEGARSEHELRIPVASVMQRDVWTVAPTAPAISAARMLGDHRFGCLPVVEEGRVIGIVTEHDFLSLVTDSLELGPAPHPAIMAEVMSPIPETLRATDTLDDARARMDGLGVRHLPIVDDRGAPLGMLSARDLEVLEAIIGRGSDIVVSLVGSEPAHTVRADAEVGPVLLDLASRKLGSVMVVDDGDALVGIFTSTDATRLLGEHMRGHRPEPPPER